MSIVSADPLSQILRDSCHHCVELGEANLRLAQVLHRGQGAVFHCPGRIDVVQVPAQPVDVPGPLSPDPPT